MPNSIMSDSGSSSVGEARMLERRVSNNRADLNGDQQMNYFLSWFNTWSSLQRDDFVPILASKMSADGGKANLVVNGGLADALASMDFTNSGRPPSLFACQVKLFRDWCGGWSDDQKGYLVVRLRDIDADFFATYEAYLQDPESRGRHKKDFFEPGIPSELIRTPTVVEEDGNNDDDNATSSLSAPSASGDHQHDEEEANSLKKLSGDSGSLSPVSEAV